MKNKKNLIQILALGPVVLIPVLVFIIASFIVDAEKASYELAMKQISQDFLETEKSRIRSKVNNMVNLVSYRQSIIDQKLHARIKRRVDDAQKIAIGLYNQYKNTMGEDDLKKLIIQSLRTLVWNGGESFIWILDFDGKFQLAPSYLRHLEGKSIIDFEDATGRKVIKEEIAIAKSQGQGFLWDTFTKPNEPIDKQFKQLAYVKNFGIYDWYLGSGEYLDTATKLTNRMLLEAINQISKGEPDYFFVIDTQGNLLLNFARPDMVGKNIFEMQDSNLRKLYQSMVRASQSTSVDFLPYNWINPTTGRLDSKLAYVKSVPGSDWIIGSGFYPNSLANGYGVQEQRLSNQHNQKVRHINTLTWLGVLISILISSIISLVFYRMLSQYQEDLVISNNELKDLNIELENKLLEQIEASNKEHKQ
ncbi:cache domain-containing protein [Thiomicrorhabdus sp. Milos-T2]|uniref:cache domain-containing protein n=1 Tax=Thiomicrorhabdus sp. Milos-T2 TaxID=90814 RepID=UPI000493EB24|nr:cache domain-containing protein [Thiomicrorhabdus sp. Milos-T2]